MTHEHNIVDTDKRFIINPIDKTITNPSGNKSVVVQYDHNSEVFTFQIPRSIEGHDMTNVDQVQIHFINTSSGTSASARTNNSGIYTVTDIKVDANDENLAVFTWPLSDDGTRLSGTISFQIKFICYGDEPGIPSYKWQTKVFSAINVEAGIDNSEVMVEENPDIILAFEERISALEKGGTGGSVDLNIVTIVDENSTDEQIPSAKAVKFYVDSHIGDIETALDGLITKQNELIGGDAE